MSDINYSISKYKEELSTYKSKLIAISKTKPIEAIKEAYEAGQRDFGENKVTELAEKYSKLPKDINWHMVGHLQRNKIKYIAPFVHLIHSVDSERLLLAIDKEGSKNDKVISVLLQVYIANEETKFGFSDGEIFSLVNSGTFKSLRNIKVIGLMGMATNTDDQNQINLEFSKLNALFNKLRELSSSNLSMEELSMGMSNDYKIALKNGSTMVRIGSSIFGERNYG